MDILIFHLDHQRYALPLPDVRQVVRAVAVTELPGAPPVVEGVVDVHGELVPVLSLRRRFGLPEREVGPDDHFVLAMARGRTVLLPVDRVDRLADVDESKMEDPSGAASGASHVAGVARLDDGLVLIHDLHRFLSSTESEDLEHAMEAVDMPGRTVS